MSKTDKKTVTQKYNPFGRSTQSRSAMEILQDNFGIGIRDFDRGAEQWDVESERWVHVPNVSRECVIEFAVNEGKGTGRQCVPASEFRKYVETLQSIVDSDFAERSTADRTEYVPTWKVAQESFRLVRPRIQVTDTSGKTKTEEDMSMSRDVVSIRCTSGKGAKPMLIGKHEFAEVVEALSGIASNLEDYEKQAWANFNAQVEAGEVPDTSMSTDPE